MIMMIIRYKESHTYICIKPIERKKMIGCLNVKEAKGKSFDDDDEYWCAIKSARITVNFVADDALNVNLNQHIDLT